MKKITINKSDLESLIGDVIDGGKNIKMRSFSGCHSINDEWTLDDCENKCQKYYSCYAVSLANDTLSEYEIVKDEGGLNNEYERLSSI